ncbi:hypothetical protein [Spirosoma linguale]|uniref:Outer membrane protein beta-barrel domain-containing protein n=1 Tax=Spirosoma linguale (strain ATCC 33905 / DSM 74 / LMG 10896 / Claus 1) TaxID=504472 RepID=D2QBU6_SPILD|nr:hypothetical protein Slin_1930 [Spirosoma linguale DSM 74]
MKNFFLLLTFAGAVGSAHAQELVNVAATKTSVGRWAVAIETDNLLLLQKVDGPGDDYYLRKIVPGIGYFATNTLLLGVGVPLGLSPRNGTYYSSGINGQAGVYSSTISPTQIGIAPFVQQFLGKGKVKPYVGASYRYTHQQLNFSIRELSVYLKQTGNESELSVFTGLTYLITPKLGIDVKLRYGWQWGNHPYMTFPNRLESSYSSTYSYMGQLASANVGLRLMIGEKY